MRGRVVVTLLLVLSLPIPASAFCDYTHRFSGQLRTTAFGIDADSDRFLWLATGYGLTLLEPVTGASPRIVDAIALEGATRVVRTGASGIGYAGSGRSLHVVRREGTRLHLVRTLTMNGTINDVVVAPGQLFVATSAGLEHLRLIDPINPLPSTAPLATSAPAVNSLAIAGSSLYAADGDASVEIFSIAEPSLPQRTGALATLMLASWVHTTPDGWVLVSDRFGQSTEIFSGGNRIAQSSLGIRSFAAASNRTHYAAGADRTLRAIDFSAPSSPAIRLALTLPPSGGNENAIHDMVRAGDTLYVAAGDIGLTILDVSGMQPPFPLISDLSGATTSARAMGDRAWFSDAAGRISERDVLAGGLTLSERRAWNGGSGAFVRDVQGDTLLTSSGSSLTLWSLGQQPPSMVSTISFPAAIQDAVLLNGAGVALLNNGTLWTSHPAVRQIQATGPLAHLAREGSAIATAELRSDGTTLIRYYANGDLDAPPATHVIQGIATGSLALSGDRAAIFTFNGISIVNLASGAVQILPGSNMLIPQQLAFAGEDLLVLDVRTLLVYDRAGVLAQTHPLPADAIVMHAAGSTAVIATAEGAAAILYKRSLPEPVSPFRNRYPTKAVMGGDHLYLLSRESVDFYSLAHGETPRFLATVSAAGVIDAAATASRLFTLSGNGTVTAYSPAGTLLGTVAVDEGPDALARSIATAGESVWVSLSTGCSAGGCTKKTVVIDPLALVRTSSMSGGVDDLVTNGSRAYTLVSLPDEIRVIDISDPAHPAPLLSAPRPPGASAIAFEGGQLYVLADRVRQYGPATLAPAGEHLTSVPNPGTQILRFAGRCAVVAGRGELPQVHHLPGWDGSTISVPSSVRSVASANGRLVLLTDHSLEVWSSRVAETLPRRRAVR